MKTEDLSYVTFHGIYATGFLDQAINVLIKTTFFVNVKTVVCIFNVIIV